MTLKQRVNLVAMLFAVGCGAVFLIAGNRMLDQRLMRHEIRLLKEKLDIAVAFMAAPAQITAPEAPAGAGMANAGEPRAGAPADPPLTKMTLEGEMAIYSFDGAVIFCSAENACAVPDNETLRDMIDQESGVLPRQAAGRPVLTAFRTVQPRQWVFTASVPASQITSRKNDLLRQFGALGLGCLVIGVLLVNRGLSQLLGRIRQISLCTRRAAEGDLSVRVDPDQGRDEISVLKRNINGMMEGIVAHRQTRSRIENELKESRQRLTLALEAGNCGTWEFNPFTNDNTVFSDRWFTMLGYEPDSFPQTQDTWMRLLHPEEKPLVIRALQAHISGRADFDMEFRMKAQDGGYRWIRSKGKIIAYDADGHPERMVGLNMDITEEKQADEEKAKMEAHIRRSQKAEAIGLLASGIAHDFNNILSAIVSYTDLALNELQPGSATARYLKKVLDASHRAGELVGQILVFSRQGKEALYPLQLKPIIQETAQLLRASLPPDIRIEVKIESDAYINGDPGQMHQLLINLCTNAWEAMSQGGGVLKIELTDEVLDEEFTRRIPEINPGPYLKLIVGDTGKGMAQRVLDRIFDPFFTTKEKEMGTGMGLSVVHGIVKRHRGHIGVHSQIDKGTTFHAFFPAVVREAAHAGQVKRPIPGGTESILIVDDEPDVLESTGLILERLGYRVTKETKPEKALERVTADPFAFHLLITDMTMPGMKGEELVRRIKKIQPDLPAILCTGFSAQIDEAAIQSAGILAILYKPVLRQDLAEKVRRVLDDEQDM